MVIYLFRDEGDADVFAFSIDVTGPNIPPITAHTEWVFLEAFETLKFAEPWDIDNFQDVLNHLQADGSFRANYLNRVGRLGAVVVRP